MLKLYFIIIILYVYFFGVLLEYPLLGPTGFQWGHLKNDPYIHLHSTWRKWVGYSKTIFFFLATPGSRIQLLGPAWGGPVPADQGSRVKAASAHKIYRLWSLVWAFCSSLVPSGPKCVSAQSERVNKQASKQTNIRPTDYCLFSNIYV